MAGRNFGALCLVSLLSPVVPGTFMLVSAFID